MYKKDNKYNTRIPTLAKGEKDIEPRMYVKDELFEGNPMDSENPVHFDYLEKSGKAKIKENKRGDI